MDQETVPLEALPGGDDWSSDYVYETGWRGFLRSWMFGAILVVACVLGVIAIFNAHPFRSPSVSERVSDKLGQPASCLEVGASSVAGANSAIYRCTVGIEGLSQCFAISERDIRQLSGRRELGC